MATGNIGSDLNQNITITAIVLTAVSYLADPSIFDTTTYPFIQNLYAISLFTLIFCYLVFSKITLSIELYNTFKNTLLINLFCTSLFLLLSMNLFDMSSYGNNAYIVLLVLSIVMNTVLPAGMLLFIVAVFFHKSIFEFMMKDYILDFQSENIIESTAIFLLFNEENFVKTLTVAEAFGITLFCTLFAYSEHSYSLSFMFMLVSVRIIYWIFVTLIRIKSGLEHVQTKKHRTQL